MTRVVCPLQTCKRGLRGGGDTSKYDLNKLSAIIINTTEKMFKFLVIQFDIKINSVKAFWDITNGKRDN